MYMNFLYPASTNEVVMNFCFRYEIKIRYSYLIIARAPLFIRQQSHKAITVLLIGFINYYFFMFILLNLSIYLHKGTYWWPRAAQFYYASHKSGYWNCWRIIICRKVPVMRIMDKGLVWGSNFRWWCIYLRLFC